MKKGFILLLSIALLSSCKISEEKLRESFELASIEETIDFDFLSLPNKTSTFSKEAANKVMNLCSKYSITSDKASFTASTIQVIGQYNYTKIDNEADTCAYTIGVKPLDVNGASRNMYVVSVRGTNSKEWYSNFNFASIKKDKAEYAENFYNCAVDVYESLKLHLNENQNPLFLVTGHSRGAATANILAKLLDDDYGKRNVYAYTFATPNTGKTLENSSKYENIFNLVNPEDLVCEVPLSNWGFHRFGKDIVLNVTSQVAKNNIDNAINSISSIVSTVNDYYNTKHSLTKSGISEDGKTPYEICQLFAEYLATGNYSNLLLTFSNINQNSDYYPLISLYSLLSSNAVKSAHNLSTYKTLLSSYNN